MGLTAGLGNLHRALRERAQSHLDGKDKLHHPRKPSVENASFGMLQQRNCFSTRDSGAHGQSRRGQVAAEGRRSEPHHAFSACHQSFARASDVVSIRGAFSPAPYLVRRRPCRWHTNESAWQPCNAVIDAEIGETTLSRSATHNVPACTQLEGLTKASATGKVLHVEDSDRLKRLHFWISTTASNERNLARYNILSR